MLPLRLPSGAWLSTSAPGMLLAVSDSVPLMLAGPAAAVGTPG